MCCRMRGPVADAEALVGSLTGQPRLEKEKAREPSVPSLSSVPSTILQRDTNVSLGK